MTLVVATPGNRKVLGCIPAVYCLGLALIGCGKSVSEDGSTSEDGDSQGGRGTLGASGSGDAGGTQGVSSGDTGGSGTDPDATGLVDAGGAAGAGSTGNGGNVGSGGVAGAGDAGSDSCVNVSGAGDEPWFDLTVVGTQFDADEGERMRVAVATQTGNRIGIADVRIVGGGFTLSIPRVLNATWYVGVTLYVDRNDNNTCETDEHAWNWTTQIVVGDMQFDVTPAEMCDRTLMGCRPWEPPLPACWVGTGDTDLMEPLPCNP